MTGRTVTRSRDEPGSGKASGDDPDPIRRLARESGRLLGELGVRPEDEGWIRAHADSIESLMHPSRVARRGILGALYRFARKAARTAR